MNKVIKSGLKFSAISLATLIVGGVAVGLTYGFTFGHESSGPGLGATVNAAFCALIFLGIPFGLFGFLMGCILGTKNFRR